MKKIILIILLLVSLVYADVDNRDGAVDITTTSDIDGVTSSRSGIDGQTIAGGCDDCSGTLTYSHHAENNDDATTNANGTCGCSDSDTYKSWDMDGGVGSATYSSISKYDGSYAVLVDADNEAVVVTETDWLDLRTKGTWEGWIDSETTANTNFAFLIIGSSGDYVRGGTYNSKLAIKYYDGTNTSDCDSARDLSQTGEIIKFAWDADANILRTYSDGAWHSCTGLTMDVMEGDANTFTYYIIGHNSSSWDGYYDAVKLHTDDQGS